MSYDPFARGAAPVGVRTIELRGRDDPASRFTAEAWYPAADRYRGQDLDDAARDSFIIAAALPAASQQAVRDAEAVRGAQPLVMYWHGGYGHRREATYLCTHLASHGYVVVAPDFPGDNIQDTLAAPKEAAAKVATKPIDESAKNRPHQASAVVDAFAAAAPTLMLGVDAARIGSCGISMGGYTALAVNSSDRRFAASFAICPMYGSNGPLPQVRRLQELLRVDDWQRPVQTFVLTGELDPLVVLPDIRELYGKLPAPKRLAVLKRAGHMHFGDGAAAGHERYRAAYLSGAFPDPEIDAIALGTAMRPFSELCSEADSLATATGAVPRAHGCRAKAEQFGAGVPRRKPRAHVRRSWHRAGGGGMTPS